MGWIGHSLALLACRMGKGEPSVQDSQGLALEIWGGRPGPAPPALPPAGLLLRPRLRGEAHSPSREALSGRSCCRASARSTLGLCTCQHFLLEHHTPGAHSMAVPHCKPGAPPGQGRGLVKVTVAQLRPTLATPWTTQSVEFSRPEDWTGQPFPSPGDLLNLGIEPRSPACRQILYQLSHKGGLRILSWVPYPSSSRSS